MSTEILLLLEVLLHYAFVCMYISGLKTHYSMWVNKVKRVEEKCKKCFVETNGTASYISKDSFIFVIKMV